MSKPEKFLQNFLKRWSRRKRATAVRAGEAPNAQASETERAQPSTPADASPDPAAAAFDPASLPPLESITAASDIRAFLAPAVPIELTRAALRRVWMSDPTIRDFIGIAENQWDFTRPDRVPGFGALDLTPELRRMLAELHGDAPAEDLRIPVTDSADANRTGENCSETPSPAQAAGSLTDAAAESSLGAPEVIGHAADDDAATQDNFVDDRPNHAPAPVHRKHGRALPK